MKRLNYLACYLDSRIVSEALKDPSVCPWWQRSKARLSSDLVSTLAASVQGCSIKAGLYWCGRAKAMNAISSHLTGGPTIPELHRQLLVGEHFPSIHIHTIYILFPCATRSWADPLTRPHLPTQFLKLSELNVKEHVYT